MKRLPMLQLLITGALVAGIALPTAAQKKIEDLKYPSLNKMEIPEPERVTLDNGVRLYLREDHTLPLVDLSVRMSCGSFLDPAAKVGLAVITGSVMRTGGTQSMSGDDIDARLEAIGASVETGIGTASGSASANGLSEYAETIVSVLADVMRHPIFDEDKIDLARTEARAVISRRNDDPMQINVREFRKLIYGAESPIARYMEYATVEAISHQDLVDFHAQYVQPQGTQIAIWGDFKTDEMVALITQYFGDWSRGAVDVPKPPEVDYDFVNSVNYAEKTDVNQSNIFIGHIGGRMGDPDYPATIVMNTVLGGFGGRLFGEVRTTQGLAYAVAGTYSFSFSQPGMFYVFTSTKSEQTVQAIESCIHEIERMRTEPPTPDEMTRAKDGYLNSFVFNFDTQGEILGRMMTYDYYDFPADYLQQIKEGVEKVTPEDVVDVAQRKLHPDHLQIMVTGNGAEFGAPLADLGYDVNVIDITIPEPSAGKFVATEEELAKGRDMLAKSVEACGGLSEFKAVEAALRESKVTVNMPQGSMSVDVTTLDVFPDMTRQVMKTPMGDQIVVFNGTEGWMQMGGNTQMMPAGETADLAKSGERNIIRLFQTSDDPDYQVAFKGTEALGETEVHRLDFLTVSGAQFTMFLNSDTYRPAGMRYMGSSPAGPAETLETIGNFMQTGQLWLPSQMHRDQGQMSYDIELVTATLNPEYNEVDFQKPDNL